MTCSYQNARERNVFISSGGDDALDGSSESFPCKTLTQANALANALTPSLSDPVLIKGLDGTRYTEASGIAFGDYVRVNAEDASITGFLELPTTAYVRLASVVTIPGINGVSAVKVDSKDQTSLVAFGVFTNGDSCIGYDINGTSSDVFADIGQIAVNGDNSIAINYTSTGTPRRLSINEINMGNIFTGSTPTGCEAIHYETTNNTPLVIIGSAITQNGSGNTGIHVVDGSLVTNVPDIELGTDLAIEVETNGILAHQGSILEGNIENAGSLQCFVQSLTGDITSAGVATEILAQSITGDISNTNTSGRYSAQDITGDITHVSGGSTYDIQIVTGNIDVQGGSTAFNADGIFGTIDVTGGTAFTDIKAVSSNVTIDGTLVGDIYSIDGNLTINAGAAFSGVVNEVAGSVIIDPTATVNGVIAGIKYGSWEDVDANNYVTTFLRDGTIPTSWETIGSLTIDTTNDSIDPSATTTGVQGSYEQTTGGSRTVDFRLIDADDSTVYYTGTSTASGAQDRRYVDLTVSVALPSSQVVNLLMQCQRTGFGGGVNGGGGLIEIKRT